MNYVVEGRFVNVNGPWFPCSGAEINNIDSAMEYMLYWGGTNLSDLRIRELP